MKWAEYNKVYAGILDQITDTKVMHEHDLQYEGEAPRGMTTVTTTLKGENLSYIECMYSVLDGLSTWWVFSDDDPQSMMANLDELSLQFAQCAQHTTRKVNTHG